MTRVPRRAAQAQAVRARSRLPKPQLRKHKIVMESVTQEKKKLRSVISFETQAPPGYTFIPAGNPQFTNACKEMCRKEGHKVFTVSTTPHQRTHDLSQQVHRIGFHFPSVVVATICMERGLFLSATGKVLPSQQGPSHNFGKKFMSGRKADSELSQNTINTEARDAIKDLFPNIPKKDLGQIIKTAFQKGKRKVGTAVELPLARRVQLAVVAHIRHIYTDYDRLLRVTSFQEARTAVEEPTLAKLVQWRGDDENGKIELEDVFREVIVISDNEDEDNESDTEISRGERDSSVEIVSSKTIVGELQTRPVNYGGLPDGDWNATHDQSDDEAPPGFRFVAEPARKRKPHKQKIDRRGFNRYQAWDRAIDRYREAAQLPTQVHPTRPLDVTSSSSRHTPRPTNGPRDPEDAHLHGPPQYYPSHAIRQPLPSSSRPHHQGNFEGSATLIDENEREFNTSRRDPPNIIRLADGTVFERAGGTHRPNFDQVPSERMGQPSYPLQAQQRINPEQAKYPVPRDNLQASTRRSTNDGHRVLPSIEGLVATDHPGNRSWDYDPLLAKKRDGNAMTGQQLQPTQDPMEGSSGKLSLMGVNDDRHQFPQKRNKLEHDGIAYGNPQLRGRRAYPQAAYDDLGNNQSQALYPLGSRRQGSMGRRPFSPSIEKPSHTHRQYPEDLHLPGVRREVADMQPVLGIPHKNQLPGDFLDHERPNHGPFSQSFHRSDGPGYMSASDNPTIRSRPISYSVHSQQQPHEQLLDHYDDELEVRGIQERRSDGNRPALVRPSSPEHRQLASSQRTARANNIYAPDFVRPVPRPHPTTPSRYEGRIPSPRQTRPAPARNSGTNPPNNPVVPGRERSSMPSGRRLLRSPSPSAPNLNHQYPFSGSHDDRIRRADVPISKHPDYIPDIHDPPVQLLDSGRYPAPDTSQRPIYRHPPARVPIPDRRPYYDERVPASDGVVVMGNR